MKHLVFATFLLAVALPARSQSVGNMAATDRRAILEILKRQTEDWNAGRVDKFMTGYWPSDSLTFVGKNGITYGYQPTLANYKKRYPDRASMGSLKFDILHMDFPGPNVAYVIGRWHLTRPQIGDVGDISRSCGAKSKNAGSSSATIPANSEQLTASRGYITDGAQLTVT